MVKVLHCVETIGSGGVEQRRLLLAKYLDKTHFSQFMICSNVKADFDKKLENFGMPVFRIGSLRHVLHLAYYVRLIRVVRKIKPDIIHGAIFEGVISAVVAGLICRVPIILIEETSDPVNRKKRATRLLKFLSFFADFVIGISPSVVSYLSLVAGVNNRKIRLINNATDNPEYPTAEQVNDMKIKYSIKNSDFIVGSVGRMYDSVKRFSDLIKALPLLIPSVPGIKLLIVGGGKDLDLLKQLVKNLQLEERVVFTGFQERPSVFYAAMDVFALVSDNEGFGLVVVEAMYFKRPVVVTAVGGMKDIVIHEKTGIQVSKHDPVAISEAIKKLYSDKRLQIEMGEAGYERAISQYSAQVYVGNISKLYDEALHFKQTRLED
jgi:glycosyltransferase involved in cell wall biosynthesis